jgi:phosphoribosylaminoimidazolecarboxamide formyltransferase / IMP cyclohydrolase
MADDLKTDVQDHRGRPFPAGDGDQLRGRRTATDPGLRESAWTIDKARKGLRYGENPGPGGGPVPADQRQPGSGRDRNHPAGPPSGLRHRSFSNPANIREDQSDRRRQRPQYPSLFHRPADGGHRQSTTIPAARPFGFSESAYHRAYMADRVAAFGGCIAVNRSLDRATAEAIAQQYAEVVVAPEFEEGVLDILARRKNLRVIRIGNIAVWNPSWASVSLNSRASSTAADRPVVLCPRGPVPCRLQTRGMRLRRPGPTGSEREPTEAGIRGHAFGWLVESGITSNSVIYVKDGYRWHRHRRAGPGRRGRNRPGQGLPEAGRPVLLRGVRHRLQRPDRPGKKGRDRRAGGRRKGRADRGDPWSATPSFRSGTAWTWVSGKGISAVVQPGGSANDYQSIEACNEAGATMVFTGQRSFKH